MAQNADQCCASQGLVVTVGKVIGPWGSTTATDRDYSHAYYVTGVKLLIAYKLHRVKKKVIHDGERYREQDQSRH